MHSTLVAIYHLLVISQKESVQRLPFTTKIRIFYSCPTPPNNNMLFFFSFFSYILTTDSECFGPNSSKGMYSIYIYIYIYISSVTLMVVIIEIASMRAPPVATFSATRQMNQFQNAFLKVFLSQNHPRLFHCLASFFYTLLHE